MSRCLLFLPLMFVLLASSCGNKRVENLQEKIDSLRTLEQLKELRRQSMQTGEQFDNPLQAFFDSLEVQVLPLYYVPETDELYSMFTYVPEGIKVYLNFESDNEVRAAALPRRGALRIILLAAFEYGEMMEMWLYSLDEDYFPIDQVCLYDAADDADECYFAITSDYRIYRNHVLYHINIEGKILEDYVGNLPDEEEVDEDYVVGE